MDPPFVIREKPFCNTSFMHFGRVSLHIILLSLCAVFSTYAEDDLRMKAGFERMGPYGGDVRSLLIDVQQPQIVYSGTSSGKIFKSTDAGNSWIELDPGIGKNGYVVDTLIQHPVEKNHIYAGAWDLHSDGGGLFESKDGGLTWTAIVLPNSPAAVRGIAICKSQPSNMLVGTLGGAYVSSDGGRKWERVGGTDLLKARSVAIDPEDPKTLYVGTWRLAYKSSDFGKTWTRLKEGMALDSDVFSISISTRNPRIVYSSACSGVYRSANRAQPWKRLKLLPDRLSIRAHLVIIDPTDDRRIYGGTTEGLFVSDNEGRSWNRLTSKNLTINAIQINPLDGRQILIGTEYEGIFRSEDAGKTWKESNTGFIHKNISWIFPDTGGSSGFVAGVQSGGGGLYFYDEADSAWTLSQIEPGLRILSFLILPEDQGRLAGTTQGVYWQRPPSRRWTKMEGSIAKRTIYSLEIDTENPVIYAGTDQGIFRATLSAMKFRMRAASRLRPKAWCFTVPASDPGIVYAGTSLGLLRSYDRGTTWNVISAYGLPDRVFIRSIAVSPSDKDHLLAGTSVGLYESMDGGVRWKRSNDRRLRVEISSIVFLDASGERMLAADKTAGGVFYSQNRGKNWSKLYSPGHDSPISCISRIPEQPNQIYMGTQTDGIYRLSLP